MEPAESDEILRTLVQIATHQETINTDIRASLLAQQTINERLTTAIERLETTQARIETLLARMLHMEPNGREA